LARLRQTQQQQQDAARQAEIDAAAKKGDWQQVLALRDAELTAARRLAQETEARAQTFALDSQLAQGLAGYHFVDPAWGQRLTQILRSEFQVFPVGGTYEVRSRDGRTVGDYLKAEFEKPMYRGILSASTAGGIPMGDLQGRVQTPGGLPNTPFGNRMSNWLQSQRVEAERGGFDLIPGSS
jgi:hypothetical protein